MIVMDERIGVRYSRDKKETNMKYAMIVLFGFVMVGLTGCTGTTRHHPQHHNNHYRYQNNNHYRHNNYNRYPHNSHYDRYNRYPSHDYNRYPYHRPHYPHYR